MSYSENTSSPTTRDKRRSLVFLQGRLRSEAIKPQVVPQGILACLAAFNVQMISFIHFSFTLIRGLEARTFAHSMREELQRLRDYAPEEVNNIMIAQSQSGWSKLFAHITTYLIVSIHVYGMARTRTYLVMAFQHGKSSDK